jgi:hypothetical protein
VQHLRVLPNFLALDLTFTPKLMLTVANHD